MRVWAWGANSNGRFYNSYHNLRQCGLGFLSEQVSLPTEVPIVLPSVGNPNAQQQRLADFPNVRPVKIEGGSADTIILVDNAPFNEPFEWQSNFQLLPYPKVRDIACGWDFCLYLSDDGVLHSRGNNGHCQLGRRVIESAGVGGGDKKGKMSPNWGNNRDTGDVTDQSIGLELTKIAAGLRHGVVTNSDLKLLVWGHNSQNQIGPSVIIQGNENQPSISAKVVESPRFATVMDFPAGFETGFTLIACGKDFTIACDEEGFLYGSGSNKYGTMCHAPQDVKSFQGFTSIFEQIPNQYFPGNISDLKCGWAHVVCLLDTGKVVTWGRNDLGQLGRDSVNPKFDVEPKQVPFPEKIVSIACGSEHNLALGVSGSVYSWGWNEHDNCGVPIESNQSREDCIRYPVRVNIPCEGKVEVIGCGAGSSYAVSK